MTTCFIPDRVRYPGRAPLPHMLQAVVRKTACGQFISNDFCIYNINDREPFRIPYVKCMLDPLIYGLRMREPRQCLRSVAALVRLPIDGFLRRRATRNDSTQMSSLAASANARQQDALSRPAENCHYV